MTYHFFIKLGLALFLGLLIGIDRQLRNKPLGVKTSMVISVASCLITIVSIESVHRYSEPGHTTMDPMRLAAQIVSGVGFLGAGVILRRGDDVISGLTTASMVWAASGLGIAVGAGFYLESITAMLLIILAINIFPSFIKKIGPSSLRERELFVKMIVDVENEEQLDQIFKEIKHLDMQVRRVKIKDYEQNRQSLEMILISPKERYTTHVYAALKSIEHMVSVEVQSR
ncbi:methyltransferase [Tumebacillus algifaecis]|uniref:Methyltransferase n=1 Tax=Tumebacillus algifaecis TaxID=1214604 RepID=A0A223D376_9BACL|nr:MgtC/SapB family protein [Tumebacillus algifaecis]ASS76011.1 methyltransferase [Tumebacillus algifaecis]